MRHYNRKESSPTKKCTYTTPLLLLSDQVVPEEFESSISEPESDVLPLHHGTIHLELQPHPKKANQAMLLARLRCKGTIKIRKGNNPTDFLSLLPFPHFPSKKGEEESLKIKKESAGKYSDFCLRFCKKQPMKHSIPALKRKKRRAAKSEHFTAKIKAISRLNSVER